MKLVPDKWIVLQITDGKDLVNKVLAGWYGGYLGSDMWRLNSGNTKEQEFDDRWEFTGSSGSVYVCYKDNYGMSSYMRSVLDNLKSTNHDVHIKTLKKYSKGKTND
jgi:hypothetical protein